MPLPETISVKYTEEDAEFLSIRPVVRQTFQLKELLDMVLSVCGKDLPRIQKLLRCGTVVFHFYRYRWPGFEAEEAELAAALAAFPDADPARIFQPHECSVALLESGAQTSPEWKRADADRRRILRRQSFWEVLMELAQAGAPHYLAYSYEHKGDLFAAPLSAGARTQLRAAGEKLLPAGQRGPLASLCKAQQLLLLCPRR